ncbi:MAG: hypothetical protein ACJ73N_03225 [Bryobacteraceae bacterium]
MPFFFIVPIWCLAVLIGLVLLFVKPGRWLATYVLCGSTGSLLVSLLVSLGFLMATAKLLSGTKFAWLALVAYLIGIGIGAIAGALGGIFIAWKINRRLGLSVRE